MNIMDQTTIKIYTDKAEAEHDASVLQTGEDEDVQATGDDRWVYRVIPYPDRAYPRWLIHITEGLSREHVGYWFVVDASSSQALRRSVATQPTFLPAGVVPAG